MKTHATARLPLLAATLLATLALGACGSTAHPTTTVPSDQAVASGTNATGTPAAAEVGTTVAHVRHGGVAVHGEPRSSAPTIATLRATTPLGSPTTLLVLDHRADWVEVALASRPNGSTGWVADADVEESTDDVAITVSLAEHRLRVTMGDQVVVETPVAVGAPATPTPTGHFYVTDLVDTGNPGGAYGPFALGISAHSDVLDQFAGGDGQIGIHGTNQPGSIGQSVSHGCVRVPDEVIVALSKSVPLGTPVTIA